VLLKAATSPKITLVKACVQCTNTDRSTGDHLNALRFVRDAATGTNTKKTSFSVQIAFKKIAKFAKHKPIGNQEKLFETHEFVPNVV